MRIRVGVRIRISVRVRVRARVSLGTYHDYDYYDYYDYYDDYVVHLGRADAPFTVGGRYLLVEVERELVPA